MAACSHWGCRRLELDLQVDYRSMAALWGHEWKAVAWMALASDEHEGGCDTITSLLCSGRPEDRHVGP